MKVHLQVTTMKIHHINFIVGTPLSPPVKSYSLAEDGLEEISNASEDSDYAPNLAETVSNPRQKRVVLVSDSENQGQSDEAMYTVHVCTTDNISLHVD